MSIPYALVLDHLVLKKNKIYFFPWECGQGIDPVVSVQKLYECCVLIFQATWSDEGPNLLNFI